MKTRYERKLAKRDKRIAGMQRRIHHLESALAEKALTSEKLQVNVVHAVERALMNVRFIPINQFFHTPTAIVSVEEVGKKP